MLGYEDRVALVSLDGKQMSWLVEPPAAAAPAGDGKDRQLALTAGTPTAVPV